jgi:magnesium-transporting ATPase (P-type)
MTPPTEKTHPSLIIGCTALLAAVFGDSYLHLPKLVVTGLFLIGIACLIYALRAMRRSKSPLTAMSRRQKHWRFAMFFAAVMAACLISFFVLPNAHPEFSFTTRVRTALLSLATATGIGIWAIYFRRDKPSQSSLTKR